MAKVSKMKRKKSKGFTLIELLVVVAIIGILAAIAIPQFAEYRKRGFNARMEADVRNAATAQEAQFVDTNAYLAGACTGLPGFNASADVDCTCTSPTASSFECTTTSTKGSFTSCVWQSAPAAGSPNLNCT